MNREELINFLKEVLTIEEKYNWDGSKDVVLKIDGETIAWAEIREATYDG